MKVARRLSLVTLLLVLFSNGCQLINTGTETRMDEQRVDISFENAKAEELFDAIVHNTKREEHVKSRIGTASLSLYSRGETVAFNAHCNDHIRGMDKNGDLIISQKEAEDYYQVLVEQGKLVDKK